MTCCRPSSRRCRWRLSASWTGWSLDQRLDLPRRPTTGGYLPHDWAGTTDRRAGGWTGYRTGCAACGTTRPGLQFHVSLTSGHTYQSNPWSWLVLGRPVSYFYESPKPGVDGCPTGTESCAREVLALGTPLLWWAACFALLYILWRWIFRRDWRAGAIACGVAAGYLPWFMYQQRTIFFFYAVVFVPFPVLAVAMMVGAILGPPGSTSAAGALGAISAGVLVLLIIWNFIYFWPVFTGDAIPVSSWNDRMWLNTWI